MTDRKRGFTQLTVRPETFPLYRKADPGFEFPLDALGPLRPAVEAIHDLTQAAIPICANAALAVASLAVCPHFDVRLPFGQSRPTSCLFATIAASGDCKTSADAWALRPVRIYEAELKQEYKEDLLSYRNDHDAWAEARTAVLHQARRKRSSRADTKEALDRVGPPPVPPEHPLVLVDDLTSEGLIRHLRGRFWAGVFANEGALFLGRHAWRKETQLATAAQLNGLWDGTPLRRVRASEEPELLDGRRIAAHLLLQPEVADVLFGDPLASEIGLIGRFLSVAPASLVGTRFFREPQASSAETLEEYNRLILAFLRKKPKIRLGGGLDPVALPLSAEARPRWIAFHDWAEEAAADEKRWAAIRAWALKAAEHAARLAAILTVLADPEAIEVEAGALEAAIALTLSYGNELKRILSTTAIHPDLRLAEQVFQWWCKRDEVLHATELYRCGPVRVREKDTALRVMQILVTHGHAELLPAGTVVDGAPRRYAWRRIGS